MRPKPILLLLCLSIAASVNAQTPAPSTSPIWRTYSVKDEKFAVNLPALPELDFKKIWVPSAGKQRLEISFGAYADGVIYTIWVVETLPNETLDSFVKKQTRNVKTWDLTAGHEVTLDGAKGKAFDPVDNKLGMVQFFAKDLRLFQFMAYGAPLDDPRMTKFFSSITLTRNKDSLDIADSSTRRFVIENTPGSDTIPAPDPLAKTFTSKEVDSKVRLGFKAEPSYTEEARQHSTTGVVTLKCLFSANGTITNISTVTGLPHGLTERAIAAARKIKFIPAIKDGQFVSQWMTVEFYFNLY